MLLEGQTATNIDIASEYKVILRHIILSQIPEGIGSFWRTFSGHTLDKRERAIFSLSAFSDLPELIVHQNPSFTLTQSNLFISAY